MRVHHALGVAGGAAGEEHRGHVVRLGLGHFLVEQLGPLQRGGPALLDQRIDACQAGLGVVAQAARLVVPDVGQMRTAIADLDQLVHLLLVFDDRKRHFRVGDRKHELGRYRVLVQRHRHRAQRLRSEHRGIQAPTVFADHHHMLAALQAGSRQAQRQLAYQLGELSPAQRLPDAVFLLAQRRRIGPLRGVLEHEPGEGGVHKVDSGQGFDAMLSLWRQS
jgi:hypothetical protein